MQLCGPRCPNFLRRTCGHWLELQASNPNRFSRSFSMSRGEELGPALSEAADHFAIVYQGSMKLTKIWPDGSDATILFMHPGDTCFIHLSETSFTVPVALTDAIVCVLNIDALRESPLWITFSEELRVHQLRQFSKLQLRNLLLSISDAEYRLAGFLLSERDYSRSDRWEREVYLPYSRSEIGSYLLVTPSTVSRSFSRLKDLNMIETRSPRSVHFLNKDAWQPVLRYVEV